AAEGSPRRRKRARLARAGPDRAKGREHHRRRGRVAADPAGGVRGTAKGRAGIDAAAGPCPQGIADRASGEEETDVASLLGIIPRRAAVDGEWTAGLPLTRPATIERRGHCWSIGRQTRRAGGRPTMSATTVFPSLRTPEGIARAIRRAT